MPMPQAEVVQGHASLSPPLGWPLGCDAAVAQAVLRSPTVATIGTDLEGVIQTFNGAAERMFGCTAGEMVGQRAITACGDHLEVTEGGHAMALEAGALAVLPEGQEPSGWQALNQLTHLRKDGSQLVADLSVNPLVGAGHAAVGYLLLATDSAASFEAEERLVWAEESFHLMVDSITDCGCVMLNPAGHVLNWNAGAQRIKGYTAEAVVGQHCSIFYSRKDRDDGVPERDLATVAAHGRLESEGWRARQNGELYWARTVFTAVRDHRGRARGFVKLFRDCTAQRQAHQELVAAKLAAERADASKSNFLAQMSHELRTPLNAILGFSQLLDLDTGAETPQKAYIGQILSAGWHMTSLVDEVLDLARVDAGQMTLHLVPVPLRTALSECQAMMAPEAGAQGISLQFDMPAEDWAVMADAVRLKQVLLNLVSNALKYNHPNGRVTVGCVAACAGALQIQVRDTGRGLSDEQLAQLFQPFNRLGQELGPLKGTGLGLVTTQKLVSAMGGSLRVESTVGAGSCFCVDLPPAQAGGPAG